MHSSPKTASRGVIPAPTVPCDRVAKNHPRQQYLGSHNLQCNKTCQDSYGIASDFEGPLELAAVRVAILGCTIGVAAHPKVSVRPLDYQTT
jgi:hypothetical protein